VFVSLAIAQQLFPIYSLTKITENHNHTERRKNMGYVSYFLLRASCFSVFVLVSSAAYQNPVCPFDYLFHTGDGFFDVGNAIRVQPEGPMLPANNYPYGITDPGFPSGRWCDGLLDIDFGGAQYGFPTITPSLIAKPSNYIALNLATTGSPILEHSFFELRGVQIPSYAAPLRKQFNGLREYLSSICSTPAECTAIMRNSLFISGDVEANDIGYALIQGKSIEEARTYVPFITEAQISSFRELVRMGTRRITVPGNAPLGCVPYILTALRSNNTADYDDKGCLKKVNDLIKYKNQQLESGVNRLKEEFPNVLFSFGDIFGAFETILQDSLSGPNKKISLKACCGIGGEYNFDSIRFCGTPGVPVCADPLQYLHWDGIRLTQNAQKRLNTILIAGSKVALNCTG
ncbi:SGNH/GDSL hydrolase family protein, partial [Acinetobacter baumannii]